MDVLSNFSIISIISISCLFGSVTCSATVPTVTIPTIGTFIGSYTYSTWTNRTIYQFLGIRYAKSPSGARRFKPPESVVDGIEQTHNALNHGRPCPNYNRIKQLTKDVLKQDLEDCLYLSVYSNSLTEQNPVMVFIHGGQFETGNAQQFAANYLLEKDIVLVTIQYRLGPLGFLSTKSKKIPGNAGFHDVIMALNWVKSYVEYFGGNPNKITIFGGSAGGVMVSALVLSPAVSSDLFQQAIMQSGSYFSSWGFDENPVQNAKEFIQYADCTDKGSIEGINRCLMDISVVDLYEAHGKHLLNYGERSLYGPSRLYQSDILPLSPYQFFRSNVPLKDIRLMGGVTKNDGAFLGSRFATLLNKTLTLNDVSFNKYELLDRLLQFLEFHDFTGSMKELLQNSFFDENNLKMGNFMEMIDGLRDIFSFIPFKGPVYSAVNLHSKSYPNQTYLYTFDYKGEFSEFSNIFKTAPYFDNGVNHGDELFFLFPSKKLNKKDIKFAKIMVELWTSFAIHGVPKCKNVPDWPTLKYPSGPYLHIDSKSTIDENFLKEFWISLNNKMKSNNNMATKQHMNIPINIIMIFMIYIFNDNFLIS